MLDCVIVGLKNVDFDTKEGQRLTGVKIFVTCQDNKVSGLMTDSFFLQASRFPDASGFCVGDHVAVYFNRYGKVDSVSRTD